MPTINSLLPPYPTFRDAQGNPLNGGFVYIGQPGLEARTTPKASFFDEALTIPTGTASGAAVRTSAGYPVGHNGSPANVYVDGDYSITVLNSAGVMVFSALYPTFALDTGAAEVGPVLAPDGNLSFPGFAFTSDQDTGFSRPGSGQIQTVANGVLVSTRSTETGTTFAQPVPEHHGPDHRGEHQCRCQQCQRAGFDRQRDLDHGRPDRCEQQRRSQLHNHRPARKLLPDQRGGDDSHMVRTALTPRSHPHARPERPHPREHLDTSHAQ
jgi:hypothetical protein